jgi:hypothetical protein
MSGYCYEDMHGAVHFVPEIVVQSTSGGPERHFTNSHVRRWWRAPAKPAHTFMDGLRRGAEIARAYGRPDIAIAIEAEQDSRE